MQNYQEMMKSTFDHITQIGAGGGGTIFKAYHKRLGIDVVLKKIHVNKLNTIAHEAEKDILKGLKNDYIPKIYDFIEYGEDVFTVMEYIPGDSFADLLKQNRRFSQKEVAKWLLQLCKVVDYLHSQKPAIIHCDIKPANIMLTPEGNICLIDFNISGVKTDEGIAAIGYSNGYAPVEQFATVARYLEEKKAAKAVISEKIDVQVSAAGNDETEIAWDETEIAQEDGTEIIGVKAERVPERSLIRALSDEEWQRAKELAAETGKSLKVDERTDIYSVGACMYHILTGVKPQPFYKDPVPVSVVLPNVSESLAYVIDKAMALKPQDRFKSSGQLLKTVRNIGTVDKRYKALVRRQWLIFLMMLACSVISAGITALGKLTMAEEKEELYAEYVEAIIDAAAQMDYEEAETSYEAAAKLFPERQEAYYQMAGAYYEARDYETCIVFLNHDVYGNALLSQSKGYDRFYYLTASCYFDREDYETAIAYYEMALQMQENEIAYYRDYVIALARNGQIDEAEQVLNTAVQQGISSDIISLLKGEIALMKDDHAEAEIFLQECIAAAAEDYTRLLAYTRLDEAYQGLYMGAEACQVRITYLKTALEELPSQYQVTLLERLAQVYIDLSDIQDKNENCQNAISVFEQMERMGYATFTSRYNVAVLYEKMGMYDDAMLRLQDMQDIYANNYNIYKRMAFVELSIQAAKANASRDYHTFEAYYDKAVTLYQESTRSDDIEMLSLQQLYHDVVSNGWL